MDPSGAASAAGLQSGFVLAVILAAVFFAEKLGGTGQLAQRGYQVALGLVVTFLVLSATKAFDRAPELEGDALTQFFDSGGLDGDGGQEQEIAFFTDTAQNASEVRTIHAGLGIAVVVAGLALLSRFRVVPLGLVVGGVLLLLFGGVQPGNQASDPFSLYLGALGPLVGSLFGLVGQARDIAHFAVLLAGAGALAGFGYWQWEREVTGREIAAA